MKTREQYQYTEWVNTMDSELRTHFIRITFRLCLDELHDVAYWKYMEAAAERRRFLREKCISLYVNLFEDYIELGGEL